MGQNAARRRTLKLAAKASAPHTRRPRGDTKTVVRLRARMAELTTLSQFEEILSHSHPDHRGRMRRLLEPMLPPELPCCGPGKLKAALGQPIRAGEHSLHCPTRNRVTLAHA